MRGRWDEVCMELMHSKCEFNLVAIHLAVHNTLSVN